MRLRISAVVAVGLLTWLLGWHVWGVLYGLGVHPYPESSSTPWTYQLWSGFIPGMAIVTIFGGVWAHIRSINCHVTGCWRIGHFLVANGQYKVCGTHHPDGVVRSGKITHAHIRQAHEASTASAGAQRLA